MRIEQINIGWVYNNYLQFRSMLNKLLGRKEKGLDIFNLPDRKYCNDSKKLAKMEKKDLLEEIEHMEKHVSTLTHKLEDGRKEYEKVSEKLDEASEKVNVLNSRMSNINNEHEELLVKFENLQQSLEIMTREKEMLFKTQLKFIDDKELTRQRVVDLGQVMKIYRDQIDLMDKVVYQNKQFKQKYMQLEVELENLTKKMEESQMLKSQQEHNEPKISSKSRVETEADEDKTNQYKLLLETKEQMVIMLNKRINDRDQRIAELEENKNQLAHELEKKTAELKQRDQFLIRLQNQVGESKRKIGEMKDVQAEMLDNEALLRDQLRKKQADNNKLKKQIIEIEHKLRLNEQQKKILIGDQNQKMLNSQEIQKKLQIEMKQMQHTIQAKDRQISNINTKLQEVQQYKQKLQAQIGMYKIKEKQASKVQQLYIEQTKKQEELHKKIQNLQQNYQIKLKKLQFNYNQQRIKAESLKRSLTNAQTKQQESRKQLDQLYEKKIIQDSKLVKLDTKVKHYKQMIQYLQKEKVEMEKTFQDKIKNMEEIVIHDVEEEDNQHNTSQNSDNIIEKDQTVICRMQVQVLDLQEQVKFLKEENQQYCNRIKELEGTNDELSKNYKTISDKRQLMMKQLSKMNSLDVVSPSSESLLVQNSGRERKIAEKALRGFDIMSKNLGALYKQFLNTHIAEIQRKEIKEMQSKINTMLGKCEDLKDIFQDYL